MCVCDGVLILVGVGDSSRVMLGLGDSLRSRLSAELRERDLSCHVSSFLMFSMAALHIGHSLSCDVHSEQNPLCPHGINTQHAVSSKQSVHESSFTLEHLSCSKYILLGTTFFCSSVRCPWSLKDENGLSVGGYLNGSLPKLNLHCWNAMKLAAAKKPNLVVSKISLHGWIRNPLIENITSLEFISIRQPRTSPGLHAGTSATADGLALYHTSLRQPSYDNE